MYTSCTAVHMIKICTDSIHIGTLQVVLQSILQGGLTDSRGGGNQTFSGGPEWEPCLQLLLSCWSGPAWPQRRALLCSAVFCCNCLCWAELWPTIWTSVPLSFKTCCTRGIKQRKAKWEPSVRCYKLLARPVARPREPDLAAPRLRRVKRCTQRSSLHLYAPYIGRLLLQPTGTWLLAS